MASEDVVKFILQKKRVVKWQNRAAGIAKNFFHTFIDEGFDNNFSAGKFFNFFGIAHDIFNLEGSF